MPHEVHMSTGEPTEPKSEMERLDRDWLNGGLALVRAFAQAVAEENGFSDVSVHHAPFNSRTAEDVSLIIRFNAANIKGCRNARPRRIEDGLKRFEQEMLEINEAIDRNLRKGNKEDTIQYRLPLSRYSVSKVSSKIKERLATKLPVSAFLTHLSSPKR